MTKLDPSELKIYVAGRSMYTGRQVNESTRQGRRYVEARLEQKAFGHVKIICFLRRTSMTVTDVRHVVPSHTAHYLQ